LLLTDETAQTVTDSVFHDATLRQTLHVSVAASRIRVLIQNVFGATDLPITAASIALPTNGKAGLGSINTATLKPLTFGGQPSVSIAAGGSAYTDPIDFPVANQSIVTISLYLETGQSGNSITGHPGSRTTSWFGAGNLVNSANVTDANVNHWYFVSAIEAWEPANYSTWVILGDSITDGRGTTDNGNNRWPDLVLARLQASSNTTFHKIGLANEAAGGNSILSGGLGPTLLTRYKRDAIAQPGVKWVTIFEGVNDIGSASADNATQAKIGDGLITAYEQIAKDCHDAGLKVSGATITPFGGDGQAYSSPVREATRLRVNDVSPYAFSPGAVGDAGR
jgi:lysophospholipase L1-like esterase